MLETFQRRRIKKVLGFSNFSYVKKIKKNLFLIKDKFLHSDLIKYWNVVFCESENFDLSVSLLRSHEERTVGHKFQLAMPRCNADIKQRFLMCVP